MFFGLKSAFIRTGIAIGLLMAPLMASGFEYYVVTERTQVLDAPESGSAITSLPRGQMLLRIDQKDEWSRVFFLTSEKQPLKGWLHQSMISPQGAPRGIADVEDDHLMVNADTLRVRKGPGSQHRVITSLKRNQLVKPIATDGEWTKVRFTNLDGTTQVAWTASRYLKSASAFSLAQMTADSPDESSTVHEEVVETESTVSDSGSPHQVIANHVRVRKGPGTNYKIAGKLSKNQQVEVLDSKAGWKQIRFSSEGDPMLGWTTGKFLKPLN